MWGGNWIQFSLDYALDRTPPPPPPIKKFQVNFGRDYYREHFGFIWTELLGYIQSLEIIASR